jgi:membrane-bound acyltransferase YfiQ involved in biofilm formation
MLLIGNIAALPQLVLAVIMFDIFSFNVVGEHVLSIWLIILILAISGAVILTAFFIKAFLQTRKSGK